jgi:FtsH-binding integral membrane protein
VAVAGEAGLAAALIPAADLKQLVSPASHAGALGVGVLLVGAAAAALVRYPAIVPVVLLAAAPFRISVSIGTQKAYLLLPLYAVLAAAVLALVTRALRGDVGRSLPSLLAVPAAVFVALAGVSLLWTRDPRQGTIELLFFLFPFSALVVAVARTHFRSRHPRALAATLVALAGLFSAVALFQRLTHGHLLAGDVARANAYTT